MADIETAPRHAVLEVAALSARTERSPPIRDVSFSVGAGAIAAVIGPAGAGRGTLLDALAGLTAESRGAVRLLGRDLARVDPCRRRRAGLLLARADAAAAAGDSVCHALAVALALARRPPLAWLRRPLRALRAADWREIEAVLQRTGLAALADRPPATLPRASRRCLQLAEACVARPRLLLLDHPWRGLAAAERAAHARVMAGLRELNIGVLVVEDDLALLAEIADRVLVLAHGRLIADAPPAALAGDDRVAAAFLGEGPG
jgi:branched-chain amino acid transport system ATP-binding protein